MRQTLQYISIVLRRIIKRCVSCFILAPFYYLCCLHPIQKGLVVLADGHQDTLTYSLQAVKERLKEIPEFTVVEYFHNYSFCGMLEGLKIMLGFMPLYARAEYVFICDCYVPAASCRKRQGTTLIQLWHSCGLMKKVGVHSPEDAASMMKTQYRNTDIFTASSESVSDVLSEALLIPRDHFCTAGVPRMDLLYRKERIESLRRFFHAKYPEYRGKKLVLWAPTFRGDVRSAYLVGDETVVRLQEELKNDYAIVIRTHRFSNHQEIDTPIQMSSEQLMAIADVLITDYSSIYYDYLFFRKPIILFAPDLETYEKNRGLYIDYQYMPGYVATTESQLRYAITHLDDWANASYRQQIDALWEEQMTYCDGHSTDKLLREVGILPAVRQEVYS